MKSIIRQPPLKVASGAMSWSTTEDACSSNGGASADEEPTAEEAPTATTTTTTSMMMTTPRPVLLTAVNPHIICHLCQGYLINATTIVECLHSFCHSCLINHLRKERYCPRCEMVINNAKPNIKSDTTLQAIVYKLVPGLYERELMRKRAFYKDRPQEAALATPEQRGDDTEHLIFSPSDDMSLSLEYAELGELNAESELEFGDTLRPRYLQCPAMCRVSHLKKFVYDKFEIDVQRFSIDIMYKVKTIVLLDYYTLMDIAYIYTWKRDAPMRFYFRVYESPKPLMRPQTLMKPQVAVQLKQEVPSTVAETPVATISQAPLALPVIKTQSPPPPARIKVEKPAQMEEFRIDPKMNSPTDQPLKLIINRNFVDKPEKSHHSPKNSSKSLPSPTASPGNNNNNKEEPNIKLKIDLSKHNSVTIINMSDPERKEIVKPLKPEKESRSKSKKDKDGSPKSSSESSRKRKSPSPLTVPPLTIRTERILSPNGVSTVLSPRITSGACVEDPKSEFLKSFALTPIKVKVESPEKSGSSNGATVTSLTSVKSKSHLDDRLLMKPPSAMPPKSIASSKRKSKEPIKAVSNKKPKLSPPLPREDFKIRLPVTNSNNNNSLNSNSAPASSVDKPLMPPPTSKAPIAAARHKAQSSSSSSSSPSTPSLPLFAPLHHHHPHHQGMQLAAPGNRTPIAKRYQPILPKAHHNPFANIPSDVNRLLKDAGTEIKSIASQAKTQHVYGPKLTTTESKMGPPPTRNPATSSGKSASNNNGQNNHHNNSNSNNKSNNYLNLALFNASKSKGKEAPPGCRTPMYTPNSPIYSPSSPQYVPNYNIPTMPTYKYTPKPTNTTTTTAAAATTNASNYLQSMLNGASNGGGGGAGGGLFPTPPTKCDQNTNPRSQSPCHEDAPEKQQVKVKSLLNSCNINIPSSLSITISRDNGDASSPNSGAHAKHKSPVNNYIEIVKLPDQPATATATTTEQQKAAESGVAGVKGQPLKLPAPPSKTIPSPQHLLTRLTPPQTGLGLGMGVATTSSVATTTTTTTSAAIPPPKTSPAGTQKTVLQPQQSQQADKKTPSPEKRSAAAVAAASAATPGGHHSPSGENKSPKSQAATNGGAAAGSNDASAAKKFRPILPRELAPKLPPAFNLAPKKVPASKKSPNNGNANKLSNPVAAKLSNNNSPPSKKHCKVATPPPTTVATTAKMPPPHPQLPNLNAPLSIASSAAAAAAANSLDLSNFLKENLMRAQVAQVAQAAQAAQAAAAAANQSNLLYNFAPSMYNYQQAYFMEQLSRMQRAGNEVFNDYLQKLKSVASAGGGGGGDAGDKSVMPMLPTVTLPSPGTPVPMPATPTANNKLTTTAAAATPSNLAKSSASPRPNNNNNLPLAKSK
ncbi:hypothetical protein ACLKA6_006917 [Drosophila palustris]